MGSACVPTQYLCTHGLGVLCDPIKLVIFGILILIFDSVNLLLHAEKRKREEDRSQSSIEGIKQIWISMILVFLIACVLASLSRLEEYNICSLVLFSHRQDLLKNHKATWH